MADNVLFKKVSAIEDVSKCTENQIVFCESTGEIYTHSTRYGAPIITEIGSEESGDIQMIPNVESRMASKSTPNIQVENEVQPMSLNIDIESSSSPEPGYISYDGKLYSPSEYKMLDINPKKIDGVYIGEERIVELENVVITQWGAAGVETSSNKYGTFEEAVTDMDGDLNSFKLNKLNMAGFTSVSDGWYVPALGELDLENENIDAIQTSIRLAGGSEILNSYYWSSTSGLNNKSAWAYNFEEGKGQLGFRDSRLAIRRIKKIKI